MLPNYDGENQEILVPLHFLTCQAIDVTDPTSRSAASLVPFEPTSATLQVNMGMTIADIQGLLMKAWEDDNNPFCKLPLDQQFFVYQARVLKHGTPICNYYLEPNDTVYIRFSSLGKVCDASGMSWTELRAELQSRRVYEPNLSPEQLILSVKEVWRQESRLQRLQKATIRLEHGNVIQIADEERKKIAPKSVIPRARSDVRPKSLPWPTAPSKSRTVFLSISALERVYERVPRDILDPAICIFDVDREWVFEKQTELQKRRFDAKYMNFDEAFLQMLSMKEEDGLVFWFRPDKSYEKLSSFIQTIVDPSTGASYQPLILKPSAWLTLAGMNGWEGRVRSDGRKKDMNKKPKFTSSVIRVVTNLESQSFEYTAVQELLHQSNPMLLFPKNL